MNPSGLVVALVGLVALLAGCAGGAEPPSAPASHASVQVAEPAGSPAVTPALPPAPVPVVSGLPPGVAAPPAGTNQLVTVLVPSASSTTGTLRAWRRGPDGGWTSAIGPVTVRVGTDGVGAAKEGMNRTPRGTFALPSAFGRQADPGTKMPYRKVDNSDWWVSDQRSPSYNTYRRCAQGSCPFDEQAGENLGRAGSSYDYAVVIGYNIAPVRPGAGSAFFVHTDAGVASAGCVVVPRASMTELLRWLDSGQRPRITIGLG
jgi:L,D-peptidoglycan transpeptidase YkuD (ErfK/YbiS/YcfS/YnhG family)